MGAVYFYHLTRTPIEITLPMLLEKSLAAGWHVLVRGRDDAQMGWLDQKLWLGADDGFLPHGLCGGPHDAAQPVLLTTQPAGNPNSAACLMAVHGADVAADEVSELQRVCVLFDGNDTEALERARDQWKILTKAGCHAQYWSEESGRWQKQAESGQGA